MHSFLLSSHLENFCSCNCYHVLMSFLLCPDESITPRLATELSCGKQQPLRPWRPSTSTFYQTVCSVVGKVSFGRFRAADDERVTEGAMVESTVSAADKSSWGGCVCTFWPAVMNAKGFAQVWRTWCLTRRVVDIRSLRSGFPRLLFSRFCRFWCHQQTLIPW